MAREDYEVLVRIERDTISRTDSGGETATETTVASGQTATVHYHSGQQLQRAEGTFLASGPGLQTVTGKFFKFEPPFPSVRVNDRIIEEVAGTEWHVEFVRTYSRTMQVDVRVVEP